MSIEIYQFKPMLKPVIAGYMVKELITDYSQGRYYITLDLGFSVSPILISGREIYLEEYDEVLKIDYLKEMRIKENSVYIIENGMLKEISLYSNGKYYRLMAVRNCKAPTLEINGIHMHRIKGICPWDDAASKVKMLGIRKSDLVLDTCTGLGYTAIASLRFGARKVYTIEIDENVLTISGLNPWSRFLENENIIILLGNTFDAIDYFKDYIFDKVIHDPPRFSLAGELYSEKFYHKLFRVIKPKGKLFHYVGKPGEAIGRKSITKGVINRLMKVGFIIIRKVDIGVIAQKPRF